MDSRTSPEPPPIQSRLAQNASKLYLLDVVAGIVFGNTWFFGDVLNQLLAVIQTLGDNGLVGLLAAAILINLLR